MLTLSDNTPDAKLSNVRHISNGPSLPENYVMKLSISILVAIFLLSISSGYSQEIPKGVNYKRASDSVNALAKANLEQALVSSESVPPDFFGEVVVVGPLLWKSLKPSADKVGAKTGKQTKP